MVKKLETQLLVASLEKASRKSGAAFWKNLAEIIEKPKRHNVNINLAKLDTLARQFKGSTLVVPGKVLSGGEINTKTKIIAISASQNAITKMKGKADFVLLSDYINDKAEVKGLILVK